MRLFAVADMKLPEIKVWPLLARKVTLEQDERLKNGNKVDTLWPAGRPAE